MSFDKCNRLIDKSALVYLGRHRCWKAAKDDGYSEQSGPLFLYSCHLLMFFFKVLFSSASLRRPFSSSDISSCFRFISIISFIAVNSIQTEVSHRAQFFGKIYEIFIKAVSGLYVGLLLAALSHDWIS